MQLIVNQLCITAALKGNQVMPIVKNISLSVSQGEKLAIVGSSGCGKTMTALALLGLLPDNCTATGNVLWAGIDLLKMKLAPRRKLLGTDHVLIPQSGSDFLNPSLTIKTQMKEALLRNGVPKREVAAKMCYLLQQVGLSETERVLSSYPFQLSGGMAQRVVMAMAAAGDPKLVIADEPTKGIDRNNTELFLENLNKLFGNSAVLLITHDISVAAACDHILVMNNGEVEEYGEATQVLTQPTKSYTHQLICDLPHALSHLERGLV